jgi:hypothetical protein
LGNVNIVAFFYPLIADWDLMEKKSDEYRQRVRSAIREEMIHSVQVITVKSRYERSAELLRGLEMLKPTTNISWARSSRSWRRTKRARN